MLAFSRREFLRLAGLTAVAFRLRRVSASGQPLRGQVGSETAVDGFAWVFDPSAISGQEGLVFPAYFPTEHKVFMPLIRSN